MNNLKVVKVDTRNDVIEFDNGFKIYSDHQQDCCEHHYLDFSDLIIDDFDDLEFDLTDENFFNRIEDYGIELKPIKGHSVKVPGYGSNNGYYGSNIDLVIENKEGKVIKTYDISECQEWNDY